MSQVMLSHKRVEHFFLAPLFRIAWKEILVSQVMAAADHHEIDTRYAGNTRACNDVRIATGLIAYELFFANPAQSGDLIAQHGCFLVVRAFRRAPHATFEPLEYFVLLA